MTDKELLEARQMMANFFKARREELNMSQIQLAEKTGLGIATIKRFENAMFWPAVKQYIIICEALNIVPFTTPIKGDAEFIDLMRKHWMKDQAKAK